MALTDTERRALADAVRVEASRPEIRKADKAGVVWLQELILRGDGARHLNHHMVACEVAFGLGRTDDGLGLTAEWEALKVTASRG